MKQICNLRPNRSATHLHLLVSVERIELPSHGPKPRILPLNYTEKIILLWVLDSYQVHGARQILCRDLDSNCLL